MTIEDWDGVERRTDDRFTKAMADVRDLKEATSELAEAVTMRTDTLRADLWRRAIMLALLIIFGIIMSFYVIGRVEHSISEKQDTILCRLDLTYEQRQQLGKYAC